MTDQNSKSDRSAASSVEPYEAVTLANDPPDTITGRLLDDRFLIEKNLTEIGGDKGGMGIVYLAQDLKLMGRKVVVKILSKTEAHSQELARKFEHEKESLIRLEHPNVVRLLDAGTLLNGDPFLVMEYIQGNSLRHTLNRTSSLPLDFVAHVVEAIAGALGAAHAKGILHRDIKPENIMLTPQDETLGLVRLIDFGIARVEESRLAPVTVTAQAIGTPQYMAPEQLAGGQHTTATDIYSFGLVIYEMIVGKAAYEPSSLIELFQMHQDGAPRPGDVRKDLSKESERILLSALEHDTAFRPQDARSFGSDLCRSLRVKIVNDAAAQTAALTEFMPASPIENAFTYNSGQTIQKSPRADRPRRSQVVRALVALLILAALAIPAGIVISNGWRGNGDPNADSSRAATADRETGVTGNGNLAADPVTSASIKYFLEMQKMRDGKPYEQPFKSLGQETFESGYKFKMHFEPAADGFMYVFNEGIARENVAYFILYPTPATNSGSADVRAARMVNTGNNEFKYGRGTEIVWMIWTKEKSEELESVRRAAFAEAGEVKGEESLRKLRGFIQKHATGTPDVSSDPGTRETTVRAGGDVVVHRIELEHR